MIKDGEASLLIRVELMSAYNEFQLRSGKATVTKGAPHFLPRSLFLTTLPAETRTLHKLKAPRLAFPARKKF